MDIRKNEKQTFIVEIINHQKCTWQGQIHWVQGNRKVLFRSVMEMLQLMDSVIEDGDGGPQEAAGMEEK